MISKENILVWSSKNKVFAHEVNKTSRERFWFRCKKCNHEDEQYIYQLNPKKCFFCDRKKLCGKVECQNCFQNSVASLLE